jgi:hypothetical protein
VKKVEKKVTGAAKVPKKVSLVFPRWIPPVFLVLRVKTEG